MLLSPAHRGEPKPSFSRVPSGELADRCDRGDDGDVRHADPLRAFYPFANVRISGATHEKRNSRTAGNSVLRKVNNGRAPYVARVLTNRPSQLTAPGGVFAMALSTGWRFICTITN